MRAKTIAAFLAATVIVAALAAPAGASAAKPRQIKQKASVSAELRLRGTHGFRVELFTFGARGVFLNASRWASKSGVLTVNYSSFARHRRDTFDGSELYARIGRLGQFRGRFVPTSTESRKLTPECEGDPTRIEKGYFVGSFNFRGEGAYTVVHAHRARGTVTRQAAGVCKVSPGLWHESKREIREEKEQERNEFHLVAGDEHANVLFQARREDPTRKSEPGQTTFQASVDGGKVGDFSVNYSAFFFDLEGEAATDFQAPNLAEPLAEATVTPPAPFSGSATFHLESPKTASWTGDLSIELPGLGKVPLIGGGIDAGLCNGSSNCTKTLPKGLQPILEAPSNVIVAVFDPKSHS
ncbi:MAG: hypothetical protein ACRDPE_13285 [Solirubrobacterales bacterium]